MTIRTRLTTLYSPEIDAVVDEVPRVRGYVECLHPSHRDNQRTWQRYHCLNPDHPLKDIHRSFCQDAFGACRSGSRGVGQRGPDHYIQDGNTHVHIAAILIWLVDITNQQRDLATGLYRRLQIP